MRNSSATKPSAETRAPHRVVHTVGHTDDHLTSSVQFDIHQTMSAPTTQPALTTRQFEAVAKALADPRRMALLESIGSEREYSCQKLCTMFPVSKGTVSHHMKELVHAGLIQARRDGQYMFYEVRREMLAAYTAELMRRVARVGDI